MALGPTQTIATRPFTASGRSQQLQQPPRLGGPLRLQGRDVHGEKGTLLPKDASVTAYLPPLVERGRLLDKQTRQRRFSPLPRSLQRTTRATCRHWD